MVPFSVFRCLIIKLPLHSTWNGRKLMMLWVITLDAVVCIISIVNIDFFFVLLVNLSLKKKIASLLKIPFLDEEAPSNTFPRRVSGISYSFAFQMTTTLFFCLICIGCLFCFCSIYKVCLGMPGLSSKLF